MNFRRAVLLSLATYAATFVISFTTALIFNADMSTQDLENLPQAFWLAGIVLSILITVFASYWFFLGKNIVASMENGLKLGAILIGVGFILDFSIFLPSLIMGYSSADVILEYYLNVYFWINLALVVVTCGLVGNFLSKKK